MAMVLGGCAGRPLPDHPQVTVLIPGAGGNGPWYAGLRDAVGEDAQTRLAVLRWGAPLPLFVFNFQDRGIHERAEKDLASRISRWREAHPDGRLVLLAHSAGCGVALGALGRLEDGSAVDQVVLLSPSVSPTYDLAPAIKHVRGQVHIFCSDRDEFFLSWRTGTFGTYDNVRTAAAGNAGFANLERLPAELREKVVQHAYHPAWEKLGHDGGHWGATSRRFAGEVIAPLLVPQ